MKILVKALFSEEYKNMLTEASRGEEIFFASDLAGEDETEYDKWLREADVIIGNPTVEEIKRAANLKYIQSTNAGVDKYIARKDIFENIILCGMSGAFGEIISEYVIAGILTMYRNFPKYFEQKKEKIWRDAGREETLAGKKALILGTGDIGTNVAKRLGVFGVHTTGIRRIKKDAAYFDRTDTLENLEALLEEADIVIGCLPKTEETMQLLDERRLRRMKKDALLVNVGRGSLIVQNDLVKVLKDGHLKGAVLDVTDIEPLKSDDPLWELENVFITPHISGIGFGHSKKTEEKIAKICCTNLEAFKNNIQMLNVINMNTGYRSRG